MYRFKKSNMKKAGAAVLAGALVCSTAIYGAPKAGAGPAYAETESTKALDQAYPELLQSTDSAGKSETVYAVLNADGSTKKVTISEWLKNSEGAKTLNDVSYLKDIENTSGNETFKQDGSDVKWDANGKDIYYSGTYHDEMPVTVHLTYYLNGEEISADDLAGKKGDVKIRFDYTVNDSVTENGYRLTRPYAMISAVVLNNEDFSDVTVDNGKAINDGDTTAVIGMALPGLSADLDLGSNDLDIPESVTIRAHTTNFHIDGTYTVADSGFLSDVDTSSIDDAKDKVQTLKDSLNKLSKASKKLVDGSEKLSEGAYTVADSTDKIEGGAEKLQSGTSKLKVGSGALATGTGNLLDGANQLSSGASDLSAGADAAKEGADNLSTSTDSIYTQSKKLAAGANSLNDGASKVQAGMKQASAGAEKLSAGATQIKGGVDQLASSMSNTAKTAGTISQNLNSVTPKTYESPDSSDLRSALEAARASAETDGATDTVKKIDDALQALDEYSGSVDTTMQQATSDSAQAAQSVGTAKAYANGLVQNLTSQENQQKVAALTQGATDLKNGADNLAGSIGTGADGETAPDGKSPTLMTGVNSLAAGATQLDAGVNGIKDADGNYKQLGLMQYLYQLNQGTSVFADKLGDLQSGASTLSSGAKDLASGASDANDGAQQVSDGADQADKGALSLVKYLKKLVKGTDELSDGADTLAAGMGQFNEDGIQKMVSKLKDTDIDGTLNRVEATMLAAQDGSFIGGKAAGASGESKIIFKTAEIQKESK